MENLKYSRRKFIGKYILAGSVSLVTGVLIAGSAVSGIAKEGDLKQKTNNPQSAQNNPCDDLKGVSADEIAKRKKLAYVNKTPIPDSHCSNCALYLPPAKDKPCGGCILFKGPVRSEGYCAYWAPINN
jgi:hypothetical protein